MFKNYLKIALRNLTRQKGYSILNIAGLSIGLTCTFLITVWIFDEVSYDRFHESGDRIYRVLRHTRFGDDVFTQESAPLPLFDALKAYPEVDDITYISGTFDFILKKDELAARHRGLFANRDFFSMFSWNLIKGARPNVLSDPSSIVISASVADKYFGPEWRKGDDIVGQPIHCEFIRADHRKDFIVSGVFEEIPHNSSLQFDFVLPMEEYITIRGSHNLNNWNNSNFHFFVKVREGFDRTSLGGKIIDLQNDHIEGFRSDLFLQPYLDQHMYSAFQNGRAVTSRVEYYVMIFSIIALMIILIASINFMNLATARSIRRAREIGVRKAIGARRRALIEQFMGESLLLVSFAFLIGLILTETLLPAFNQLTGKEISLSDVGGRTVLLFGGVGLFTAIVSGLYPALFLSSFNPISILRNRFRPGGGSTLFRKGLVVFQFAMSIFLIIGTVTVYQQIQYIHSKDLGLNRENVIYLRLEGEMIRQREAVVNELRQQPGIVSVTTTSGNPLEVSSGTHGVSWRGKNPNSEIEFQMLNVNYDFLEVMKMELVSGRDFSPDFAMEPVNYIVNETAARIMGFENPVGETLNLWNREAGRIVGLVKDFHMSSFYSEIEPTILRLWPQHTIQLFVRTEQSRTKEALASLRAIYEQFNPGHPFEYHFLDESFEQIYHREVIIGKLIAYFTAVALVIACLGLLGLATHSAEIRIKEIGIRKVLGATEMNIISLLNKNFLGLVLIGFVIAVPVADHIMSWWLRSFAYRIEIGVQSSLLAGGTALLIALITVSWQSMRAATTDPVKSLKSE